MALELNTHKSERNFVFEPQGPLWNLSCDQELNLGHGSESTIGPPGKLPD